MHIPTLVVSPPIEKDDFKQSVKSMDIFYDSHSTIQENDALRRPSIQKLFSSAFTNKSISIPIRSKQDDMSESIVLMAQQRKWSTQHTKRPLQWKEYRATITKSGYLKLYPICTCHHYRHLIHMCLHQWNSYYSQASYKIDLQQEHPPSKWSLLKRSSPSFSLSLISPVDFTWSLESKERVFYFQTRQIKRSQAWYRTIYQSLPPSSKHALPKSIDLNLPELNLTIQLPLNDSEANIDLKSVRDSALALLNQYQHRPSGWNKKTVGVCWHYQPLDSLHWEVIPYGDHNTTYLIGPQLIEGPYTLELRQWTPSPSIPSPFLEGYLMQQDRRMLYAKSVGHYLFLYQLKTPKRRYRFLKKRKTAPSDYTSMPDALIGMVDLSEIKQEAMRFNQQAYTFQPLPHAVHASHSTLVKSDKLYTKSKLGRLHTFQQQLCLLTSSGDLYTFNKKNKLECHVSLKRQHCFIYSGEACCAYIGCLPNELPCRLFQSGKVVEQEEPSQCCFVIVYKKKQYLFLTRTRHEKEAWVQAIYSTF